MTEIFSKQGRITDVQLKYTKEGKFRKFAFLGYQNEQDAAAAIEFFNNTCIDTSRINVQTCADLGAETKPQAWSKYAKDSSTYKKLNGIEDAKAVAEKEEKKKEKKNKKERMDEIYGEHKNDPKFIEFMNVHDKGNDIWNNDLGLMDESDDETPGKSKDSKTVTKPVPTQSTSTQPVDDDGGETVKLADQSISDMDYFNSLKNKSETKAKKETKKGETQITDLFTIKIREIPFKTKRKDVIKFFKPVKVFSIRLPMRKHGFCYVGFKTEKEFSKAMLKNRSFLNGKQVILMDFTEKNKESAQQKENGVEKEEKISKNPKWAKQEEALKDEEDISESGRIFFRNLSYTTTEDQLQTLFEKYGPVTEISLPIDPVTRKIKGFGTVTFVMPEHAVRAFSELDGSTFQGRLLHLIPGKSKDNDENNIDTSKMSFKEKKELELKKMANSSHNWNALFLGANAVASTLAKSYNTTKAQVLDIAGGGSSAAVRLALGETELILEMRKFLEANDVVLDAFSQLSSKRSKTVILVKNLPADTQVSDLQPLFAKFGLLGRVVLPPSGITAIIEYLDSSEAKKAFKKLAYTKFKNLPLYLEWAPEKTFKTAATTAMDIDVAKTEENGSTKGEQQKHDPSNPFTKGNNATRNTTEEDAESEDVKEEEQNNDVEDEYAVAEPEPGTTLFLRNLKFTTQLETVQNHFKHIGKIHHVQIAMKKDPQDPRNKIPLGYGFIQFKLKASAEKALKTMPTTFIDGNAVELKRSDRTLQ